MTKLNEAELSKISGGIGPLASLSLLFLDSWQQMRGAMLMSWWRSQARMGTIVITVR